MLKLLNTIISGNSNILNQLTQFTKANDSQHQSTENASLSGINQNIKLLEGIIKEESSSLLTKFGQLFKAMGPSKPQKIHDHFTISHLSVIAANCKSKPIPLKSIISSAAKINILPKMQMPDSSHIQELRLKDEMIWKLKSSLTKLIGVLKPKGEGLLQASKDIMLTIQKFK
jgi:hypothetical protein